MTTGIYGPTPGESLARYVQGSESYWKMSQVSFLGLMDAQGTPDEFSEIWPQSGLMLGGIVYPRHQRALHINDSAGGSSGWATPKSQDAKHPGISPAQEKRHGPDLTTQVVQWPTPRNSEYKGAGPHGSKSWKHMSERDYLCAVILEPENVGVLSPDWVEWLMSVPSGWTRLEPVDPSAYSTWVEDMSAGRWWLTERDIPRLTTSKTNKTNRLKALGNGIVPAALARFLTYDD